MSTRNITKRELPPALEEQKRLMQQKIHEQVDQLFEQAFRFWGMDTIDAAVEILDECGRPLTRDDLLIRLKSGGIAMLAGDSKGGADANLKRSIGYSVTRNIRLREINELIGLAEWPDDKFSIPQV